MEVDVLLAQRMFALVFAACCGSIAIWLMPHRNGPASAEHARGGSSKWIFSGAVGVTVGVITLPFADDLPLFVYLAMQFAAAFFAIIGIVRSWPDIIDARVTPLVAAQAEWDAEKMSLIRLVDEGRRRLRDVSEISGDWLWQTDDRGIITYVSEGVRRLYGLEPGDLIGRHLFDFDEVNPDDASIKKRRDMLESGKAFRNIVIQCRTATGDQRILSYSGTPIFDDDGQLDGFHGLGSDITSDYRLQEERATAAAKDMFLASMSHEIRTPLNGVLGLLDVLKETDLDDDQKNLISTATDSGNALLFLINDILDFSKLQSGRFELTKECGSVSSAVSAAVEALRPLATKNGNELRITEAVPKTERVQIDSQRYRQICTNLIGNAIKFTRNGTIRVHIETCKTDDGLLRVRTSVIDSGVGIPKSRQHLLFKEFSMIQDSVGINPNGTGLGLALCKNLVEAMGGDIGVESAKGKGSTFWFEVPFEKAVELELVHSDVANSNSATHKVLANIADPIKILLAEDNPTNVLVTERMLSGGMFDISVARNGEEAVEQFRSGAFDIILMDVSMPVLDGLGATRKIREFESTNDSAKSKRAIPIIGLTAHALVSEREHIIKAGMTSVVSKPFRKSQLLQEIAKLYEGGKAGVTAATEKSTPVQAINEIGTRAAKAKKQAQVTRKLATAGSALKKIGSESVVGRLEALGPRLDRQILNELANEVGAEELSKLMDVFSAEMAKRQVELKKIIVENDTKQMARTCHALAGSCGTVGGMRLAELCRRTEVSIRQHPDRSFVGLVNVILAELKALMTAISDALNADDDVNGLAQSQGGYPGGHAAASLASHA